MMKASKSTLLYALTSATILLMACLTFSLILDLKDLLQTPFSLLTRLCYPALVAVVILYGAFWYKTPHGNGLRYLFLAFSFMSFLKILTLGICGLSVKTENFSVFVMYLASLLLSVYVAGRLNKLKQNVILMGMVAAFLIAAGIFTVVIYSSFDFFKTIRAFTPAIVWLILVGAYTLRYQEHKLAGISDK